MNGLSWQTVHQVAYPFLLFDTPGRRERKIEIHWMRVSSNFLIIGSDYSQNLYFQFHQHSRLQARHRLERRRTDIYHSQDSL